MIKTIIFGCQKITLDIIDYLIREKRVKILKLYTYELPADFARTKLSLVNEAKNRNIEVVNTKSLMIHRLGVFFFPFYYELL